MRRLDIVTLEFAKALIEEETGKPLELPTRLAAEALKDDAATAAHAATAGANGQGNGAAAEKRLIARDANKNPLLSVYDWTPEAIERVLRVPAGFMRNMTQERIEGTAGGRHRPAARRGRHRARQDDDGRDDRQLPASGRTRHGRAAGRRSGAGARLGSQAGGADVPRLARRRARLSQRSPDALFGAAAQHLRVSRAQRTRAPG
jgi:hypothetical protein